MMIMMLLSRRHHQRGGGLAMRYERFPPICRMLVVMVVVDVKVATSPTPSSVVRDHVRGREGRRGQRCGLRERRFLKRGRG